jgi:hypothetical protein
VTLPQRAVPKTCSVRNTFLAHASVDWGHVVSTFSVGCRTRSGVLILEIYNDAVLHTTATYDYEPRTLEHRALWFLERQSEFGVRVQGLLPSGQLARLDGHAAHDGGEDLAERSTSL